MKPIAIGLSPNTQRDDIKQAITQLFKPGEYTKGKAILALEKWFEHYFQSYSAISFNSARSALYAICKSLELKEGDEVLLQAFTCVVVPNAIIAVGATPIYCDIKNDYTIDPKDLEKKITKKTKAILVQHTFGIPTDMDAIMKIAKKYKLFVIEDVAHTIGGEYNNKKLGAFGDASIFSLGRDKAFSSVFGGIALTNDKELGEKIRSFQSTRQDPSIGWILQQLIHPITFSFILPLYSSGIGKILLVLLQKLHVLSFPVSSQEKQGKFTIDNVKKMPNALAALAITQLKKLDQYNQRRITIAKQYTALSKKLNMSFVETSSPLLRFPIQVKDPQDIKMYFRKHHIYLGDWYQHVIDPKQTNKQAIYYQQDSEKNAERMAQGVINLPTYPVMLDSEVQKVCDFLETYVRTQTNNK